MFKFSFRNRTQPRKKKRILGDMPPWLDFAFDLIKIAIVAFIVVWPIHHFVFLPFYVVGPSMEPNFYDNDYLIIDEISYRFNKPERGEVVIFHSPANPKNYLIKRTIGLPNERILIKSGKVYIYNDQSPLGVELDEGGYLAPGITTAGQIDVKLAGNEYYVLGDNRNISLDSRVFGPIKKSLITGRAWFRGWPLKTMGFIKTSVFAY